MKRWHVCIAVRPAPCTMTIEIRPRLVVTDGVTEFVSWSHTPMWWARLKAWRLNRAAGNLPDIDQVRAERKRYDDALREVDAR